MVEFYLLILLLIPGHEPIELESFQQSDLLTCLASEAKAEEALKGMTIEGGVQDDDGNELSYTLAAKCNLVKIDKDSI